MPFTFAETQVDIGQLQCHCCFRQRTVNEIVIRILTLPHVCCCTKMQKFTVHPVVDIAVDLCFSLC